MFETNDNCILIAVKLPVVLMALSCNEVLLVDELICAPCPSSCLGLGAFFKNILVWCVHVWHLHFAKSSSGNSVKV